MPPRINKKAPPKASGPCPNPHCSSDGKFFANLNKHIGQKQDCLEFMMALRKQVVTKTRAFESKNLSSETALSAAVASVVADSVFPPIEHTFSQETPDFYIPPDDADDAADQAPPPVDLLDGPDILDDDLEEHNFNLYMVDTDDNFLVNSDPAACTNARRVEITLLKILTELDSPLWAFRVIMEWAFDAHQSGYDFMPHQKSYQAQLQIISKWVGMAHMRPHVVNCTMLKCRPYG